MKFREFEITGISEEGAHTEPITDELNKSFKLDAEMHSHYLNLGHMFSVIQTGVGKFCSGEIKTQNLSTGR